MKKRQNPVRRDLIKVATAGSILSVSTSARSQPDSQIHPDLVKGEVVRTGGRLSADGKWLEEESRSIPVAGNTDVLVCGGGPAGAAAALSAARSGSRVLLVELAGCLGGVWTAGLLTKILDTGNKQGIMAEMLREFASRGSEIAKQTRGTVYDPEIAKAVLEELLVEAGVTILLHTRVVGALTNDQNRITGIVTESKSGRQVWTAQRFIDCTGDGDLAAQAGCEFEVGIGSDCTCQPMSMLALLTGVDPDEVREFIRETGSTAKRRFLHYMEENGIEPSYRAPTLRHLHSGIYSIMTNHEYGVSAFDNRAISEATIRARKELHTIVNGLRSIGPPWNDLGIVATAEQIGVREGRRIKGRFEITLDHVAEGLRHEQAVCRATFPIDVHALDQQGNKEIDKSFKAKGMKPYDIPYPSLVAADVDGLLLAGRCISGDFVAHSSYRVTGNSVPMGEAVGLAASRSIQKGVLPHELNWQEIVG